MQKLVASISSQNVIDLKKAALFLGISTATARNWVKCGHLQSCTSDKRYFQIAEVENIKFDIKNGKLNKLNGRANKSKAERTFIPDEYLQDGVSIDDITKIKTFVFENNISISLALLLLSLNVLQKEKIGLNITIEDLISGKIVSHNKQIVEEIKAWLSVIKNSDIKSEYAFLLDCTIPKQRDTLGFFYQSFLLEGEKSQSGSYYTPEVIVNKIINDYTKKDSKILDPCCGTGQFLLAFADVIENPKNIYGVDIDEIAVRIARLNLLIKYKNQEFTPNIICKNTLFEIGNYDLFSLNDESICDFDVIATNPPWGVHFSESETARLKKSFPEITSLESFSYFLKKSIDLLQDDGILSFILPESILNVKMHKDIREFILNNTHIQKVHYLNRVFKNVFTPVIRIDLKKSKKENKQIEIFKNNEIYTVEQSRWKNNQDLIFNIHVNDFDTAIMDKVYSVQHVTLAGRADWALGIVTGNNKAYITDDKHKDFEEIYKGKDVGKLVLNKASNYIQFAPEKFQQVAPIEKYRAKEKLIYRFISKYLIFAYDDKQKLTLNSANIVIPKIPNYPIKVLAALLNSSLYQFIFQKKFSSIKVLRSHIEQMPLPIWSDKIFNNITKLVDEIIAKKDKFEELDNYILDQLSLTAEEKEYIKSFNIK